MSFKTILPALGMCLLAALCLMSTAQAQVLRTVKVELGKDTQAVNIGPELYITRDETRNLNYKTIITRHLNNQRGLRESGSVVQLGTKGVPVWMLFTVENKSDHQSWILDFGDPSEGRYALISRLLVRNDTQGQTILRQLREATQPPQGELAGSSMLLPIPPGQTSLFVIYAEPYAGLAGTIAPRLIRHEHAISTPLAGKPFSILALGLFTVMGGFFAALAFARKSYGMLYFSLYYGLHIGLMLFFTQVLHTDIFLSAGIPAILLAGIVLAGLMASRHFLDFGEDHDRERWGLVLASFGIIAASAFSASGFMAEQGYSQLVFLGAMLFAIIFICIAGFLQVGRSHYGAPHYAMGWLFVLGGVILYALGQGGVIQPGPIVANAYWISLVPQALFTAMAVLKKIQTEEDQEQQAQIRALREAQTISKLKQTKESADQSRLLRVIEREREVMAEMRDKEMRRTEEMRVAMEHADEANRAKSAFLAVVSHEIRTPMTGIMGMVKLLQGTKLGSEQNDYVLAVQKSGDTMMALLNDILDFEKIESGNMQLEHIDFDLHKLIGGVVTLMSGQAAEKHIYLKSDIPEDIPKYVKGDPTRLRQVILNLVGNATKFTESGGVTIHLRSTPIAEKIGKIKADYEIYFAIEDTGIGIPQEVQENLFSPFAQAAASTTRKYGGTGLGLAICKKLIEAMGSSIRVSSEEGSGSTFYFTLLMELGRAELAEDMSEAKYSAADLQTDPRHILVVEDNEMNRRVFTGLLEKQGHKVVTASSGEEALKKHAAADFDLIISDVNMNGMSGMDMTRVIRAMEDPAKASIPIIALTGNVRPEDIKEFYEANMNGFLAKPIDPDKLARTIKEFGEGKMATPVILASGQEVISMERLEQAIEDNIVEDAAPPPNLPPDLPPPLEVATEPVPEPTPEPTPAPAADNPDVERYKAMFDFDLLEQLSASLGKAQFEGLMNDYIEHADRIVAALSDACDMKDIKEIKTRAHELKGMAANFGVQALSKVAAQAEAFAGKSQVQEALDVLKGIVTLNKDVNNALRQWMGTKA